MRPRRAVIRFLAFLTTMLVLPLPARAGHVHILNFEVSGGALVIPGSVTATYGEAEVRKFGWLLILFGTMVSTGSLKSKPTATVSGREVWGNLVKESRVFHRHPELIHRDTELAEAAKILRLQPPQLARLVLALDREDPEVVRERFFGPRFADDEQRRAFDVMVALARAN